MSLTKLLIPLSQQYTPPGFSSNSTTSSENQQDHHHHHRSSHQHHHHHAPVLGTSSSASAPPLIFDRSADSICNFAAGMSSSSSSSRMMTSSLSSTSAASSTNAAANDILNVAWLPSDVFATKPSASSATSSSSSSSATITSNKDYSSLRKSATTTTSSPAAPPPPDLWTLGLMPNGSIRLACPTSGSANVQQEEILPAVPSTDIPKNANKTSNLFGTMANELICFRLPQGVPSFAEYKKEKEQKEPPKQSEKKSEKQEDEKEKPSQQQQQQAVRPRGRGSANLTSQQQQQSSGDSALKSFKDADGKPPLVSSLSSSSLYSASSSSSATAGGSSSSSNNRRALAAAICYRGSNLHLIVLEFPEYYEPRNGINSCKVIATHSLGKHTAPLTGTGNDTLFQSIESVSLHYEKIAPPPPTSSSSAENNNKDSNTNNIEGEEDELSYRCKFERHMLIVHLKGRRNVSNISKADASNVSSSSSTTPEKISVIACFELERTNGKGDDVSTMNLTSASSSSTKQASSSSKDQQQDSSSSQDGNKKEVLTATTRLGWTIVGSSNASLCSAFSSEHFKKEEEDENGGNNNDDKINEENNNMNMNMNNNSSSSTLAAPPFHSLCCIGYSFERGKFFTSTNIYLAVAHTGTPAIFRTAVLTLPPIQHPHRRANFQFSGGSFASGSFTVNSKHPITRMVKQEIAVGTSLVAVLTRDNVVQVFCVTYRQQQSHSQQSNLGHGGSIRREREQNVVDHSQNNNSSSSSSSSSSAVVPEEWQKLSSSSSSSSEHQQNQQQEQSSVWPLIKPRNPTLFAPVFVTLVCSIAAPGATIHIPVDDIALVTRHRRSTTTTTTSSVSSSSSSSTTVSTSTSTSPATSAHLLVALGNGYLQTFSLLGGEESKVERHEARTTLLGQSADYAAVQLSVSPSIYSSSSSSSSPNSATSPCAVGMIFGSFFVQMRPKKK